jgi:hypothetical protein
MAWRLAKTTNRSVVRIMNGSPSSPMPTAPTGGAGLLELSRRLANTPCGSLYRRHVRRDRGLAAFLPERDVLQQEANRSARTCVPTEGIRDRPERSPLRDRTNGVNQRR